MIARYLALYRQLVALSAWKPPSQRETAGPAMSREAS
jgi:hypothetical protein